MSKITSDTVSKVAQLSSLPISSDEKQIFADQLGKILNYVDVLDQIDTGQADPTYNTTGLKNALRKDEIKDSLSQEDALKNAPNTKNGLFLTKGVFEDE